jgi:hypothetical protein
LYFYICFYIFPNVLQLPIWFFFLPPHILLHLRKEFCIHLLYFLLVFLFFCTSFSLFIFRQNCFIFVFRNLISFKNFWFSLFYLDRLCSFLNFFFNFLSCSFACWLSLSHLYISYFSFISFFISWSLLFHQCFLFLICINF